MEWKLYTRKHCFWKSNVWMGNCVEIHKDIKKIFDEELEKNCKASPTFKACFENCAIGPLFRNEKKIGAIISKTKI
jgi:hypothetical protein